MTWESQISTYILVLIYYLLNSYKFYLMLQNDIVVQIITAPDWFSGLITCCLNTQMTR